MNNDLLISLYEMHKRNGNLERFYKLLKQYKRGFITEIQLTLELMQVYPDLVLDNIRELDLSVRSTICLERAGIKSISKLRNMSLEELMKVRNLGRKSIEEIIEKANLSITLKGEC